MKKSATMSNTNHLNNNNNNNNNYMNTNNNNNNNNNNNSSHSSIVMSSSLPNTPQNFVMDPKRTSREQTSSNVSAAPRSFLTRHKREGSSSTALPEEKKSGGFLGFGRKT